MSKTQFKFNSSVGSDYIAKEFCIMNSINDTEALEIEFEGNTLNVEILWLEELIKTKTLASLTLKNIQVEGHEGSFWLVNMLGTGKIKSLEIVGNNPLSNVGNKPLSDAGLIIDRVFEKGGKDVPIIINKCNITAAFEQIRSGTEPYHTKLLQEVLDKIQGMELSSSSSASSSGSSSSSFDTSSFSDTDQQSTTLAGETPTGVLLEEV
jgi:hypothetical protein